MISLIVSNILANKQIINEKFTNFTEMQQESINVQNESINMQEEEQYQDDIDEDKIANIQYENYVIVFQKVKKNKIVFLLLKCFLLKNLLM